MVSSVLIFGGAAVSLHRAAAPEPSRAGPNERRAGWTRRSLSPVANPVPDAPPQPARCRPYRVACTADGRTAYVTLAGKEITPGTEVAVIDVAAGRERARVQVGAQPYGLALHPSGRFVVVTNRFSNFLSVIAVATDRVVAEIPVPYYCEDLVFAPDGATAYVTNFWKNQVCVVDLHVSAAGLTGSLRPLGWAPDRFHEPGGVATILRASCGTAGCHLYEVGGFYAGRDDDRLFRSATAHAFAGDPDGSPLLRTVRPVRLGGWADGVDGRHHAGGVVLDGPQSDADRRRLRRWIAEGWEGPGIPVGEKPRDLAISADGSELYVANTGSLDVSVVDLRTFRETRRIFTRSPVNDIVVAGDRLVLATLGVGSGHPKARHPGRESLDPAHPDAEFTLFRDPATGRPLPLAQQRPLGPYDEVDGTRQEKFRDITNDIVVCDPAVSDVASYAATEAFTRYTSDSFEALAGDVKGDVPAPLLRVVGAFPEQIARRGNRLYVTMSGTFEVQEWRIDRAAPPAARLVPGRVFRTGLKPTGVALAGDTLVVADHLSESVSLIALHTGARVAVGLSQAPAPFPATDFERGEFFVQTSVFSVDQDQSCVHCHYRDTSDGQRWSVSQVMGQGRDGSERTGGSREVPDLRVLVQKVPFFLEGILSIDEPLTMMMEHNPLVDFQGETPAGNFDAVRATGAERARAAASADTIVVATGRRWDGPAVTLPDLVKRREVHVARIAERYFGRPATFRDLQRFIGAYQAGEPRLLPNPADPADPMVRRGRALFESPGVGCAACHPAPAFTDKVRVYNANRAFPPVVTAAARDNIHTLISADRIDALRGYVRDWDPGDEGRVELHEGFFVAPSLRGLWARPAKFLHHGHAVHLREVLCTPDHVALRRYRFARRDATRPDRRERGLNELDGVPDTHGATSHLSVWDIACLQRFVESIE